MKTAIAKIRNSSLRILSLPGRDCKGNPYIELFCDLLEKEGMSIVNIHSPQAKSFKFDVLHLHWPQHYVTERSLCRALLIRQ